MECFAGGLTVNSYGLYVVSQGATIGSGGLDVSGMDTYMSNKFIEVFELN